MTLCSDRIRSDRRRHRRLPNCCAGAAAALAGIGLLAGCAGPSKTVASQAVAPSVESAAALGFEVIGRSVAGRAIEALTVGEGAIAIMLIATIHGNEAAGTPLLERLAREAATGPQWMRDRRLIIVPNANPDGFALVRRGNAHGVDLNRNFPASSFTSRRRHGQQPLSEPESLALHDLILQHQPDRVISIHQPAACLDYDGDAAALAQAMNEAMPEQYRLPVSKLGAYPGSLGSFAGVDLGIAVITVELPGAAHQLSDDELWSRYGAMLIAAVAHPAPPSDRARPAETEDEADEQRLPQRRG